MGFVGTQFSNKPFKQGNCESSRTQFSSSIQGQVLANFLWLAVVHACHRKPKDWSNWSKAAAPKVRCATSRYRRDIGLGYKYADA
jgi:hypothetical protein